jgi:hypothetical protein
VLTPAASAQTAPKANPPSTEEVRMTNQATPPVAIKTASNQIAGQNVTFAGTPPRLRRRTMQNQPASHSPINPQQASIQIG